MQKKTLSSAQIDLALTLQERHKLRIPYDLLHDYEFVTRFIDLFAYEPGNNETGLKRVSVIENYYYYDKDRKHLERKLDLTEEETDFMVSTLARYKFQGAFPRENELDPDPERTAFRALEKKLYADPSQD